MPFVQNTSPDDAAGLDLRPPSLDDPDPSARRDAALAAADDPGTVAALAERLTVETEPFVRSALFAALTRIGTGAALDAMLPCLASEDAGLRNAAVEAAQAMPGPVAERIGALLSDPEPDLRIFALDILQDLPHPDAPDWLAELIAHEDDPNVIGAAIDRLAECARPEMAPAIRAVRARFADVSYLRFACDFALERLGLPPDDPDGGRHA
ncbi:HEAT repeat domain-containing protein [Rhodovulum strictum]|uniref:HEAT repeat domain-containing protein n=1 Tax=Rhodovulum strictum TaxID=58314 RepID=A0A844BHT0_9RHOB|nr:HEAT repeat domain-containing protein [Rhodovulum strictum]MRH22129.1 HEAT repeat domain-containing protein [Rhodovulum strictum]